MECIQCSNCLCFTRGFFKEKVRYPVWTCRDPIFSDSRGPMILLSAFRDPIFNSGDPKRSLKQYESNS